jgi:hypothetical protein
VSASTTPIVIAGGMTMLSDYMQGKGVQYRVALATGIAATIFSVVEPADPGLIVATAWLALVASLVVTRPNGAPSPVEVFLAKWEKAG